MRLEVHMSDDDYKELKKAQALSTKKEVEDLITGIMGGWVLDALTDKDCNE